MRDRVLTASRDGAVLSAVKLLTLASKPIGYSTVHPFQLALGFRALLKQNPFVRENETLLSSGDASEWAHNDSSSL